jgi:hypothetical protein
VLVLTAVALGGRPTKPPTHPTDKTSNRQLVATQ